MSGVVRMLAPCDVCGRTAQWTGHEIAQGGATSWTVECVCDTPWDVSSQRARAMQRRKKAA